MNKQLNSTLIIIIGILASACDAPRANRAYVTSANTFSTNNTTTTGTGTGTGTNTTGTGTTNTGTNNLNLPTDINSSCVFSTDGTNNYSQSSTHAGSYNLCKSTTNDNDFYFQIKTAPVDLSGNSVQLCFIPMTTSGTNSIYIGNPMCGQFTNTTTVKKISFVKYSTYSNATINGVMFFKDSSYYYSAFNGYTNTLNAFQTCMNALYYGNTTYCNSFKTTGQYVFQGF
jgi:hypothetical protein